MPTRSPSRTHPSLPEIAAQLSHSLDREVSIREVARAQVETDARGRFAVAVPERAGVMGVIDVHLSHGRTLTTLDFEALDAAAMLVRAALASGPAAPGSDRDAVLAEVWADDLSRARAAHAVAVEHRWIPRPGEAIVHAVLLDPSSSDVQRTAFARHVTQDRSLPHIVAGVSTHRILLVGPATDVEGRRTVTDIVLREAASRGLHVEGIGSATPAVDAVDLHAAAEQATLAASLAAILPQFHPAVDIRELGGWLLLAAVTPSPENLSLISPAAAALLAHPDSTQRQTVETYLDLGANVVAAADALFIHRATLYYRLERMPEVVRAALDDGVHRSTLHLALKLVRLWEARGLLAA